MLIQAPDVSPTGRPPYGYRAAVGARNRLHEGQSMGHGFMKAGAWFGAGLQFHHGLHRIVLPRTARWKTHRRNLNAPARSFYDARKPTGKAEPRDHLSEPRG